MRAAMENFAGVKWRHGAVKIAPANDRESSTKMAVRRCCDSALIAAFVNGYSKSIVQRMKHALDISVQL